MQEVANETKEVDIILNIETGGIESAEQKLKKLNNTSKASAREISNAYKKMNQTIGMTGDRGVIAGRRGKGLSGNRIVQKKWTRQIDTYSHRKRVSTGQSGIAMGTLPEKEGISANQKFLGGTLIPHERSKADLAYENKFRSIEFQNKVRDAKTLSAQKDRIEKDHLRAIIEDRKRTLKKKSELENDHMQAIKEDIKRRESAKKADDRYAKFREQGRKAELRHLSGISKDLRRKSDKLKKEASRPTESEQFLSALQKADRRKTAKWIYGGGTTGVSTFVKGDTDSDTFNAKEAERIRKENLKNMRDRARFERQQSNRQAREDMRFERQRAKDRERTNKWRYNGGGTGVSTFVDPTNIYGKKRKIPKGLAKPKGMGFFGAMARFSLALGTMMMVAGLAGRGAQMMMQGGQDAADMETSRKRGMALTNTYGTKGEDAAKRLDWWTGIGKTESRATLAGITSPLIAQGKRLSDTGLASLPELIYGLQATRGISTEDSAELITRVLTKKTTAKEAGFGDIKFGKDANKTLQEMLEIMKKDPMYNLMIGGGQRPLQAIMASISNSRKEMFSTMTGKAPGQMGDLMGNVSKAVDKFWNVEVWGRLMAQFEQASAHAPAFSESSAELIAMTIAAAVKFTEKFMYFWNVVNYNTMRHSDQLKFLDTYQNYKGDANFPTPKPGQVDQWGMIRDTVSAGVDALDYASGTPGDSIWQALGFGTPNVTINTPVINYNGTNFTRDIDYNN